MRILVKSSAESNADSSRICPFCAIKGIKIVTTSHINIMLFLREIDIIRFCAKIAKYDM